MTADHELLGVSPTATPEELKLAIRRALMRTHPDRHGGSDEEFRKAIAAADRLTKQPCSECQGKGHVVTRHGAFIKRHPCSKCWNSK